MGWERGAREVRKGSPLPSPLQTSHSPLYTCTSMPCFLHLQLSVKVWRPSLVLWIPGLLSYQRIPLIWNHFLCFFWIINVRIQICSYDPTIKNPFHDSTSPSVTDPFFRLLFRGKKKSQKAFLCPLSPLLIFYSHINLLPIELWSFSINLFFVSHHWCSKWSGHSCILFL